MQSVVNCEESTFDGLPKPRLEGALRAIFISSNDLLKSLARVLFGDQESNGIHLEPPFGCQIARANANFSILLILLFSRFLC